MERRGRREGGREASDSYSVACWADGGRRLYPERRTAGLDGRRAWLMARCPSALVTVDVLPQERVRPINRPPVPIDTFLHANMSLCPPLQPRTHRPRPVQYIAHAFRSPSIRAASSRTPGQRAREPPRCLLSEEGEQISRLCTRSRTPASLQLATLGRRRSFYPPFHRRRTFAYPATWMPSWA